jgi:hypothetical protein
MLSAKPCCTDNGLQGEVTIKKELAGKTSPKEKECQDCSPFSTCCTCTGFILTKPFAPNLKLVSETPVTRYVAYQQPFVHDVALAIWQPPKLS